MITLSRNIVIFFLGVFVINTPLIAADPGKFIDDALLGSHRDIENRKRDTFRHPKETLQFFGLQTYMTVVEIWPARGWYSEVLAPVMRVEGELYLAGFSLSARKTPEWRKKMQGEYLDKLVKDPGIYDRANISELSVPESTEIAPAGTADMVLTFRNVHNWMKGDYAEEMFNVFARALKPGGILGVVEHRAEFGTSLDDMIKSGYVTEEHVIALAEKAGFVFMTRTDLNANSNDTKDHPAGVWTLPPTLRLCKSMEDESEKNSCDEKYTAIGESDRMTLKFRKW